MLVTFGIGVIVVCAFFLFVGGLLWAVDKLSGTSTIVDAPPEFEVSKFSGVYLAYKREEEQDRRWNKRYVTEVYDQEKT